MKRLLLISFTLMSFGLCPHAATAQFGGGFAAPDSPVFSEPDENGERMVTLRVRAASERPVRLSSPDLFPDKQGGIGPKLTEGEGGIFERTIGPIAAGVYHYQFSHQAGLGWRELTVPGDTLLDMRDVPHGVVAYISRYSPYQRAFARFHVYFPPDYDLNDDAYPVFYLLNNRAESGETWMQIGRLNFIFDNLIAAGQAKPMIVVVCEHPGLMFNEDDPFRDEVQRYVEKNYRVLPGQANRAIAGSDVMDIAFRAKKRFAYVGAFDRPIRFANEVGLATWQELHQAELTNAEAKAGMRLLLLGRRNQQADEATSVAIGLILTQHGFPIEIYKSESDNRWSSNREYLIDFAQRLFQQEQPE